MHTILNKNNHTLLILLLCEIFITIVRWYLQDLKSNKRRIDGSNHPTLDMATSYMLLSTFDCKVKALRRNLNRAHCKTVAIDDEYSIEEQVWRRSLPVNGVKQLKAAVDKELDGWIHDQGDFKNIKSWSQSLLRRVQEVIIAGFVSGAPQGRIRGLARATLKMGNEMLSKEAVLTNQFKTCGTYGYQPIIVPDFIKPLLHHYLETIRPAIVSQSCKGLKFRTSLLRQESYLFINLDGNPVQLSQFVKKFFQKHADINISPNKIRSMFATETQDLLDRGLITEAHKDSLDNINGHTSQITNQFYLRRSRYLPIIILNLIFKFLLLFIFLYYLYYQIARCSQIKRAHECSQC